MSVNRVRLFRILFVIIFLKLLILFGLYMRNNVQTYKEYNLLYAIPEKVQIYDKIKIDRRKIPSFEDRLKWMKEEIPSFPVDELLDRLHLTEDFKQCGHAPDMSNIEFHNDYWQIARGHNLTYFLFGAYYDDRVTVPEAPLVRLLVMINTPPMTEFKYPKMYCHLWLKDREEPVIVPVTDHKSLWSYAWGPHRYYPHLMDCPMPEGKWKVPVMVSLVSERCQQARNILKVIYEQDEDRREVANRPLRFVVCVKSMDFPYEDKSWRLIEWLELMRILGAGKIVFYNAQMHKNMTRVINHYIKTNPDFVELRQMSLGRGEPHSTPHFQHFAMEMDNFNTILNEMIPYNDCFYRNMYRYDYVGIFDIDEVIMPLHNLTNWSELVEMARIVPDYKQRTSIDCTEWVSFCFRNVYYPRYPDRPRVYQNLSSSFYMLQHVERVRLHCNRGSAAKCLHDTRFAVGLHNHFTFFHTINASCKEKSVPIAYAQLQHYREPDTKSLLIDPIIDDSIWRYQPALQQRIEEKYNTLGFLPDLKILQKIEAERRQSDVEQLKEAIVG